MSLSKLEMACIAYTAEYADSDECNLQDTNNPENAFMIKEAISKLSREAKLLMKTIIELPDEAFYASGQIIIRELKSYMKRRYKWEGFQVDTSRKEIAKSFGVSL